MTNKRKARVLAIDDEATMLEWLKTILENDGYEVRAAMNAARGEELFRAWKPDAVVTDLMLPDLDGVELLKRFKAAHADTEVIVLTGHGSVPKAVEAIRAGAYSFVEKPTEPDTLIAMLEEGGRAPRTAFRKPAAQAAAQRSLQDRQHRRQEPRDALAARHGDQRRPK